MIGGNGDRLCHLRGGRCPVRQGAGFAVLA